MAYADTTYAARLGLDQIERGRSNTIKCPVYRSGALVAPSSGTVTVYEPGGSAVVSAAAVTVSGSVAQYALASATVAGYSYSDGWAIEWALAMPDGVTHTYRTDAALVRRMIYPVVTDADLIARLPALDPSGAAPITSASDYQDRLDEAWRIIVRRLQTDGRLPWLVVDGHALAEVHISLTLSLILRDLATRSEGASYYADEARAYRQEYEHAYRTARLREDRDDDGVPDSTDRTPVAPTLWLGRGGSWLT